MQTAIDGQFLNLRRDKSSGSRLTRAGLAERDERTGARFDADLYADTRLVGMPAPAENRRRYQLLRATAGESSLQNMFPVEIAESRTEIIPFRASVDQPDRSARTVGPTRRRRTVGTGKRKSRTDARTGPRFATPLFRSWHIDDTPSIGIENGRVPGGSNASRWSRWNERGTPLTGVQTPAALPLLDHRAAVAAAAIIVVILFATFSWLVEREFLYPPATPIALPSDTNADRLVFDSAGVPGVTSSEPVIDAEGLPNGTGQRSITVGVGSGGTSPALFASGSSGVSGSAGSDGDNAALSTPNIDLKQYEALKVAKYTVVRRDSLSAIAKRFGLREDTLVSFNQISDVRRIQVGAVFSIPNRDGLLYTVQRGDSLSGIATQFGVTVNSILDANNLTSTTIHTSQDLFIPGAQMDPFQLKLALGQAFQLPLTSFVMTSPFGFRPDPFTGARSFHNGIDLAGFYGQQIHAAGAGTVLDVGFNSIYGNYVIIGHPGNFQTLYGHMSKPLAHRGEAVSAGDVIGLEGSTGYSTGTHLHFSIYHNNQPVNPLLYLPKDSRLHYP